MQGKNGKVTGSVVVAGGGVGGIQASLDLANSGYRVYLVESSQAIGGQMPKLDKTFPTNDCSMCIISPKLVEVGGHPNIELITYSDITGIEGSPGNFRIMVNKKARSVDMEKCTGCGTCYQKCPTKVPSEFDEGLGIRKAIYVRFPQAVPNVPVIDRENCRFFTQGKCRVCEKVCPVKAIDFDQKDERITIEAGALIVAPGFEAFNPRLKGEYGYGRIKNVITSLEFERFLSASGPLAGEVARPSDMKHPEKIAWIQCVGSRDSSIGNDYCSSVCCMYATKEAIIAKEHDERIEPTIFYMDIRAFGKDFDSYYERAKDRYGVRYIRSMISGLYERPKSKNVIVRYINAEGKNTEEEFDMVVLSVGMVPSGDAVELCGRLGIELDKYRFCKTGTFSPLETSKEGVFVCGAFQSPKDIPETVAQASGAAAYAGGILSSARGDLVADTSYPDEREVSGGDARIGVFVCHCGINIASVVDVTTVAEYARSLPGVVYSENCMYACSQDMQQRIVDLIRENNLNRVVVASCSPKTHEPLFQATLRKAGLNKYLFEMANIRDQCSWVHSGEKENATVKAKDLVRMAVANAALLSPLKEISLDVNHRGLVIGGGHAGMVAALKLADQGFAVTLLEKEEELGGNLRDIFYTIRGDDVQKYLAELIEKVENNPLITVVRGAEIDDFQGYKGNFTTSVLIGPAMRSMKIEHGITIVATGGDESLPEEYLYGENDSVLTQKELEKRIMTDTDSIRALKEIVMIQCVGSRDEKRPYCSRICCSNAIKNALKIKEINPGARIYILNRDIRTYGTLEEYYKLAREKGVVFIKYDPENKPDVKDIEGALQVNIRDHILRENLNLNPDLLVLSAAIVPKENEELAGMLKINRNSDNFYLEAHMKLRPVDFATEGIYLTGLAHMPKLIEETIAQSAAAASRAATVLSQDKLQSEAVVAKVTPELCAVCLTCVRVCPFGVPFINEESTAEINPLLCQGCGTCVSECPGKAIELQHYRDVQILAKCGNVAAGVE